MGVIGVMGGVREGVGDGPVGGGDVYCDEVVIFMQEAHHGDRQGCGAASVGVKPGGGAEPGWGNRGAF